MDSFGQLVAVPPAKLPKNLLPPPQVGIERQVPRPAAGSRQPLLLVWNPAFNPDPGPYAVVQAQIIVGW